MVERKESSEREDKEGRKRSKSIENKEGKLIINMDIGTTVFIANLGKSIREQELEGEFKRFGRISKTEVVRDPISRYVKFASCKSQAVKNFQASKTYLQNFQRLKRLRIHNI